MSDLDPDLDPGDQELLDALRDAGADLGKLTQFLFFVLFRSREDGDRAAHRLTPEGWACRLVATDEPGYAVTLFAECDAVPSPPEVARMRATIEAVAGACGGTYDDWEAAVTT